MVARAPLRYRMMTASVQYAGFHGSHFDWLVGKKPVADISEMSHLEEHRPMGRVSLIKHPAFPAIPVVVDAH